ncbi:MAG: UvrD-helicase domain-containing protein [Clostridia bacterium]|nr:UvrD-helicase domain-containing protein [Clostridia bacterium]
MATRWTDEQLSAINTRDKTLLVSAAAGSGKTATLTERIIRSLTDPVSLMDIDSILVVTFTNAAASELRAKISRALTKAVEENPEDQHLKRQLYLLPAAKIRTIDSFCNEILRANCDRVGISPGYRIADTAECELLAISIIEGLIEAVYNGEIPEIATPSEFEELADCLTDSGRTEELAEVFRYIHLRCDSAEAGIHLLAELIEKYNVGSCAVEDSVYGRYLMDRYQEMLDHYIGCYDRYIRELSGGNDSELKYLGMAESDRDLLVRMRGAERYDAARECMLGYQLVRKPSVKKDLLTPSMESLSVLRDMMKDDLVDMKDYFGYTCEQWHSLYSSLYRLLSVLYRFEARFDSLFAEEKRRRGALSYADIERYTYNCLINNGEPTDIAKNVAAQLDAIYIDEYQDVNSLQNRIFESISRPNNRFMVGDIKQSIYGFRSACPEIFASMKNAFPLLDGATGDCASIFMSRNFRCDKGVVDFVNNIFNSAFGFVAESIGYVESDQLKYSKIQPCGEPEYRYPTVCMLDKPAKDDEDMISSPDAVAEKIAELLREGRLNNGDPIRPSDVAIILRNARGRDGEYAAALEKRQIPSCISGAKDFFLSPEVLLTLCLLNTIDNPRRDIYLAGLLCSPLFDFTPDDLYLVRGQGGESLYESLVKYVGQNPDFVKGVSFLKSLDYYRNIAEGVGVDTLIYRLYRETGLMSLASRSGGKENLTLLYDYARSYEAGSFKGLYNFISFINNIIDKKTTFDDARARTGIDAVKIVTAHASKGLEYPVVFLVEADGRIYNKDRASRLAFCEDFGISFRLRTPSGIAVVNNPVQDIINDRITRKLYEEELRILYVALTRAREQLFVVGECPIADREKYETELSVIRENLSEYFFRGLSSYQEIILACEGSAALDAEGFCKIKSIDAENTAVAPAESASVASDDELYRILTDRFAYEYHSPHLTVLPEKMSVSTMSPTVLDGSESDGISLEIMGEGSVVIADAEQDERALAPSFIIGNSADESAKRGIATHLFMQFCDLDNLVDQGADAELHRLKSHGFLSAEDADRVRIREIEMFARSELLYKMRSAKRVHRELRFNVYLPACEFTADEEKKNSLGERKILVQGVIDCIIECEGGEIILCDYKTDRLTRDELSNRTLAEKKLRDKHSMQLGLYSLAIEQIFGKGPSVVQIYSLPLGDTIDIV